MRIVADVHRLPLAAGSVDVVVSNPPYPGNGVWDGDWWGGLKEAVEECRRVLRSHGRGWFLVRNPQGDEQWMTFNRLFCRWAHGGCTYFALHQPGIVNWGYVPDVLVEPLIRRWSPPGGTVLDPFAGRGCILKLAVRLGRTPIGADIDVAQLRSGGPY
jgi:DNA modification methylase